MSSRADLTLSPDQSPMCRIALTPAQIEAISRACPEWGGGTLLLKNRLTGRVAGYGRLDRESGELVTSSASPSLFDPALSETARPEGDARSL